MHLYENLRIRHGQVGTGVTTIWMIVRSSAPRSVVDGIGAGVARNSAPPSVRGSQHLNIGQRPSPVPRHGACANEQRRSRRLLRLSAEIRLRNRNAPRDVIRMKEKPAGGR